MYCQFMNTTEETLREDVKPSAEAALRCRAAIDEIVMAEGLEPDQEEITKTLVAICRQNNITMEQLKEQYDAALEQAVINSVLTGKVMRLIRDAAVVEE
jgi:FKBP-type peptidyl-prolyl cis-trans isomerase (trigger factor)